MKMLVAGEWLAKDRTIAVRNPYDDSTIDTVPKATVADVERAIAAAAGYDYRLTAWQRYEILHRFCELLEAHADAFADVISREGGKSRKDALGEVKRSHQTFLMSAEEAKRINGEMIPVDAAAGMPKYFGLVLREPIGPVVAIAPFNYPLNLVAHKVGPALAANNPVIVKPSSLTPLTALKMAEGLLEAGLPPEMLHVLTGDSSEIGDALITHPAVSKVTFTGSVPIGKAICAKVGMKAVCMELGGNDPLIVLADADQDKALPIAVDGAFGNNGQRCTSIKRIIIEEAVADEFIGRFVERTERLTVGDPLAPGTDIGPVITAAAAEEIEARIAAAVDAGATLLCGGRREGALLWPTVLDRVTPDNPIVADETFGPVAPFIRVRDFEEAVAVANDSAFGLQSGIFTRDLDKAMEAARRIQAGAVMINKAPGFRAEHLPFGGIKDSGIGREGVKYAVESMTRLKTVVI